MVTTTGQIVNKCVRCGRKVTNKVTDISEHIEKYHKTEYFEWSLQFQSLRKELD